MSHKARPLRERLLSRLVIDPSGCLLWTGAVSHRGYGYIRISGRRMARVHRVMYEMFVGPIPDGLQIDHLCRVRHCASPAHLEAVTPRENVRRGEHGPGRLWGRAAVRAAQTHCHRGHEFDQANTYITPSGTRCCVQCNRDAGSRYRARKRAAASP